MADKSTQLLTCPDCGGILESSRPAWIAAIELAATSGDAGEPRPASWHCPLCGYRHEQAAPVGAEGFSPPRARL